MKKIIILDNNSLEVHIFDFDTQAFGGDGEEDIDIQVFYDEVFSFYGIEIKDSECSWMLVDKIKIEIH